MNFYDFKPARRVPRGVPSTRRAPYLRYWRQWAGMSKSSLARLSGVSTYIIAQVERGGRTKLSNLVAVSRAFGISVFDLFEKLPDGAMDPISARPIRLEQPSKKTGVRPRSTNTDAIAELNYDELGAAEDQKVARRLKQLSDLW